MSDIKCPHCGYMNDDISTGNNETDRVYTYDSCGRCENKFGYEIEYTKNYYSRYLPCANGSPHQWLSYFNEPDYPFVLAKCAYCEEKENIARDIWEGKTNEAQ